MAWERVHHEHGECGDRLPEGDQPAQHISPIDNAQETFGLTLLEAASASLPVIASDIGGYREIVHHGHTGFLIRSQWAGISPQLDALSPLLIDEQNYFFISQGVALDLDALEDAICALASDEELRRRMGRAAKEQVIRDFDWRNVMWRYEELWKELYVEARTDQLAADCDKQRQHVSQACVIRREPLLSAFVSDPKPESLCVALTASGREVATGRMDCGPIYSELSVVINMDQVRRVLWAAESPIAMDSLIQKVQSSDDSRIVPPSFVILWLMKHGLLRPV